MAFVSLFALLFFAAAAGAQSADEFNCAEAPAPGALAACSRVIQTEKDPTVVARAYFNRGIAQEATGHNKQAMRDYSLAIKFNANYSPPYNNRGHLQHQLGRTALALKDIGRAIEIDPANYYALNGRGRIVLVDRKNPKAALEDFNLAIQANPRFSVAYANRGFAFEMLGKKSDAISNFKMALKLGVTPEQNAAISRSLKKLMK